MPGMWLGRTDRLVGSRNERRAGSAAGTVQLRRLYCAGIRKKRARSAWGSLVLVVDGSAAAGGAWVVAPGLTVRRLTVFGHLDEFPKLRVLLKRLVLLHFQSGTEKEILESMAIEDAMDHQAELMAFEINAIISHAKPMEGAAGTFQFAESVQFGSHYLLGQTAEFTQDLQLELFWHARQLGGAGRVKNDLERAHSLVS